MSFVNTVYNYNFTATESNQTILQGLIELNKQDPRMKSYIDWVLETHKPVFGRNPNNVIKWSDSYKYTQYNMTWDDDYVDGKKEKLIGMYAFVEPRDGARDSHIIVAGVQALATELANIRVTIEDLYDTIVFMAAHFSTPVHDGRYHFNPFPWLKIIYGHDGFLPIKFAALAEGTIVQPGTPIATVENTDPDCAQIVSHFEPLILQKLWYSTTCATNALAYSKVIKRALRQTASDEVCNGWLPFALQDFALRGVTCMQAAEIGCGSILYVTMGSDTVPAIDHVLRTMGTPNTPMPAYSVAAIEHNQAMMQGRNGEFKQVKRVLRTYPTGILSYVADTYDMRNFVDQVTKGELRDIIMSRDGSFVIRPDSCLLDENGNELSPAQTISEIFKIMDRNLSDVITVNSQGFRVLPPQYKIIYGDGLNIPKITQILELMIQEDWCASNIVFGVGGNFAQRIDRDTERFAMKASEQTFQVENNEGKTWIETRETCKETPSKKSKKGRFHIALVNGSPKCFTFGDLEIGNLPNMLEVYSNGKDLAKRMETIGEIRDRVNRWRTHWDI